MGLATYLGVTAFFVLGIFLILGLHLWIRSHPSLSYRGLVIAALSKVYPAVIKELRSRERLGERLSVWHNFTMYPQSSQFTDEQKVWGYVDRHSIDPGGSFHIMLSAGPSEKSVFGRVEIYRIGYEGAEDRRRVWQSDPIEVVPYRVIRAGRVSVLPDKTAAALGPNWPPSLVIQDTHSWKSGYYSIEFVGEDSRRDADVAFIVVTDPERTGDILVKLATATYQAYNRWGGHSLYDDEYDSLECRGHMVSFDRPTRSEFWEWEYYFVLWLENLAQKEGFSVSYATNFDTIIDDSFISNYKLFISVGHDEYWSKEEFDRTYDRIFRQGGNTLFLGANTAYWQVRYVDVNAFGNGRGRHLVCYKSLNDSIRTQVRADSELHLTARFRDGARRPETMLMGVAYQSNFKHRHQTNPAFAYYVENTDLPFFAGTGYKKGDFVAEVLGHEWDNRDPEAEYPPPGEQSVQASYRLWHEKNSRIEPIPLERISVVLTGEPIDTLGRKGKAEAVYFESPAGAKVFSSGTSRWTWGLAKKGFIEEKFQLLNRNLILHFLRN